MTDARRLLLQAWCAWLATKPLAGDVSLELDGTHAALRQLRDMMAAEDGARLGRAAE